MPQRILLLLSVLLCTGQVSASSTPVVDHHVHIRSADGGRVLQQAREAAGKEPGEAGPVTAERAVATLDRAGLEQAVVLSNAYMFGMPELDFENEYGRVRQENDYVAAQVARYPERLTGFYSVNPLADYALSEIERCAEDSRLTGLKLHLANSGVDFRNRDHVERLARVFSTANDLDQPIIIHMRTRNEDYGAKDARIFIEQVLSRAPDVVVQIAHLGGWSGMDDATRQVVNAFASAIGAPGDGKLERVWFDTSETIIPESRAKGRRELVERVRSINERTAGAIRALGVDRMLFGSDWVAPGRIRPILHALSQDLPLADEAVADLADNRAPYLD